MIKKPQDMDTTSFPTVKIEINQKLESKRKHLSIDTSSHPTVKFQISQNIKIMDDHKSVKVKKCPLSPRAK
jgi:hypothetical protein